MQSNPPRATDLFVNLWHMRMSEEDAIRPGMDEWTDDRKNQHLYWMAVWKDCMALEGFFDDVENAEYEIGQLLKKPSEESDEA